MTIKNRISALERLIPPPSNSGESHKALSDAIEMVASRLRSGPLEDRTDASPIERVAMAFERGDQAFAEELLLKAVERVPA